MFELIKRKLSFKVSIILALITIPPMLGAAYFITSSETADVERLMITNGEVAAKTGAKVYADMLEAAIDAGVLTTGDLMEPVYEEIKGFDFGENPRYHTRYDYFTDRVMTGFQDRILEANPEFLFAVGMDLNGYVPTHNTSFLAPMTNDRAKDLAGNRGKRKFAGAVAQGAARNLDPSLVQLYVQDTGLSTWDISSPIFVKGRHFGAFRVGVRRTAILAHEHALIGRLAVVFGALMAITVGFIFVMLRRSMRPLETLTGLATEISTGEGLDQPIVPQSTDEIGQMAKSLNRLRASLQAAMARLGE